MAETRRDLLERELERLIEEKRLLERDKRRIPLLLVTIIAAAPVFLVWGPLAGLAAVLCVPCLLLTAVYLNMVRRSDNTLQIAEVRDLIERKLSAEVTLEKP